MRGLLYCGGGHTTMVHSTPAQDTAVFATPSVCGAVPAQTPSAGLRLPTGVGLIRNAAPAMGTGENRGCDTRGRAHDAIVFLPAPHCAAEGCMGRIALA